MLPACWSKKDASAAGSTPGTGMKVPARNTINAPNRNRIRAFSSCNLLPAWAASAGFILGFFATLVRLSSSSVQVNNCRDRPIAAITSEETAVEIGLIDRGSTGMSIAEPAYSTLPPAASMAALAPLVTARPLTLTAFSRLARLDHLDLAHVRGHQVQFLQAVQYQ